MVVVVVVVVVVLVVVVVQAYKYIIVHKKIYKNKIHP